MYNINNQNPYYGGDPCRKMMNNRYYNPCQGYYNQNIHNPYFMNEYNNPYLQMIDNINNSINYTRDRRFLELRDFGPEPFVIDIEDVTEDNNNFRTVLWTGDNLQLTLMSIDIGGEIGLEMHPDVDQFIHIEDGHGLIMMGDNENNLDFRQMVSDNYAIIIPAGKWHNLINTGNEPMKLYSLYAPPNHPHGEVQRTKED